MLPSFVCEGRLAEITSLSQITPAKRNAAQVFPPLFFSIAAFTELIFLLIKLNQFSKTLSEWTELKD